MIEKKIIVNLQQGLHARPAAQLVSRVTLFNSDISIGKNGKFVNAKSIMGVMSLVIAKGEEVTLTANGIDEQEAIAFLEQFLLEERG
ncbi:MULTISPECIES: HPr family phosphocarrier protein [Aneurinibacillus]|uniref:Phosphocarrier protein HPr n=1 Tax=Aneurinibacillus thermoaerophilus TaxID=143495 RepID=A0A1G7XM59_ANETH|nr:MULTISPECIES: HPr family phosphocarrier protein [Aneurinibacillus]AMA73634.1 PTS sugar transporter subunit IIA [Aneurinibacillus sp. XH2]MED0675033.1 HPr family phosphocarrier protein [Aneurinibacillus thermoaerophilus]MED0679565.1 HPr family phosphocarrier protein [Aneurinibacillus thermoaerophilus]MED0737436.1 HPr family phosphocarrier protein [Aneurinibacillus thermoaerophilus]MED0756285.1 HPr family phosphocarrier protein [Aneurinibacillus thermoaerophilus]